jgi:transposase InsO family protein
MTAKDPTFVFETPARTRFWTHFSEWVSEPVKFGTSAAFTGVLGGAGVRISMDGMRRAYDNIFVERLWRSLKYEEVYLRDYGTVPEAREGIGQWFEFYNHDVAPLTVEG